MSKEAKWYVAHTYSGYENKVKADIEKTIENRNMQDVIQEISVPMEEVVEIKDDKKKTVMRKVFPGYVLINMIMNDDTWYVVRNTRGVTGFVGPGSKPVALSKEEVRSLGISSAQYKIDVEVGESVQVMSGPFEGSVGEITKIDAEEGMVVVDLSIFGRETHVELSFEHIKKI